LSDKFKITHGRSFDEVKKDYDAFMKKEDNAIETASMHRLAMLLQRKAYVYDYLKVEPGKAKNDLVNTLIAGETKEELDLFKERYPEAKYKNLWRDARKLANIQEVKESKDMVTALESESKKKLKEYKDKLDDKRKEIQMISGAIKQVSKEYEDESKKKVVDVKKTDELLKWKAELTDLKADTQKELKEHYAEWKSYRDQYRSIFEWERTKNIFRSESEKKEAGYFGELQEDMEGRLYTGRFAPVAHPVSKAVTKVMEFGYKHGGKVLGAAAVLAPFAIPVAGPFVALGLEGAALGVYGAKAGIRKAYELEEHGAPWATGFDAVVRDAWHAGRFSSHLTGRGSGAPPKSFDLAWRSQVLGTEYITRGFYVNEYGELKPYKQGIGVPYEELPWYIRIAKGTLDSAGARLSISSRHFTLWSQYHGEEKNLRSYIMENPSFIPEVQSKIAYQYAKMFGSIEPLVHPKQAWEMTEYHAVALSMPYQEQAKNIIIMRDYAPNPMRGAIRRERDRSIMDSVLTKSMLKTLDAQLIADLYRKQEFRTRRQGGVSA
jgi:hypothetical protein